MQENTGFRDELARERTVLANERTLLAYGRTALGIVGVALFIYKFMDSPLNIILGTSVMLVALIVWFYGMRRFHTLAEKLVPDEPLAAAGTTPIKTR